ncbi:hypothetical protein BDL97_03G015600 [Sphagnum fallax]|nr:hypothetical protein BDL97_03G015600 [Sphagnum fallax]
MGVIMGFGAECKQHNITWQLEINKTLWQASPIIPARTKTILKAVNHAHTLRNSHKRLLELTPKDVPTSNIMKMILTKPKVWGVLGLRV